MPAEIAQQTLRLAAPAPGATLQNRQFEAGRACAAALLDAAGAADSVVGRQADGAPLWPAGFVGSITHTADWLGVAVAPRTRWLAIGIDLEVIVAPATAAEIAPVCFRAGELALPGWQEHEAAARVTAGFCAKEALYKCLAPLTGRFFDFHDAAIVAAAPGMLTLELLSTLSAQWRCGARFEVRVQQAGRHVLAALALPAAAHA